jgi:hypothetical protein
MNDIKHVVSVNTVILGSVESNGLAFLGKYTGKTCHCSFYMHGAKINRLASFRQTGMKVLSEAIVNSLEVNYSIAKELAAQIVGLVSAQEGSLCFREDKPLSSNPHEEGDARHKGWRDGWLDASKDSSYAAADAVKF